MDNYPDGVSTSDIDKHCGGTQYPATYYIAYHKDKRTEGDYYTYYNQCDMINEIKYMAEQGYIVRAIRRMKE